MIHLTCNFCRLFFLKNFLTYFFLLNEVLLLNILILIMYIFSLYYSNISTFYFKFLRENPTVGCQNSSVSIINV